MMLSKYRNLGNVLLGALPDDVSQKWLAKKTFVSPEAVHYWLAGKNRPAPGRLGSIAALLGLEPGQLAELAEYDTNPDAWEKMQDAYETSVSHVSIS